MLFSEDEYTLELEVIVDTYKEELDKITTGKPSISLFDNIKVTAYETLMPLSGVAIITLDPTDPQSILFRVFDVGNMKIVEEAIAKANFNAEVIVDANNIRLRFRQITEEDRDEKIKTLPSLQERFLVKAREIRREYNDKVEGVEKVSEDEVKRDLEKIQELLKKYEEKIRLMTKDKEASLKPGKLLQKAA